MFSSLVRRAAATTAAADGLIITPRCASHVKQLPGGAFLRVAVDVGGCGGFQYRFEVDGEREEDDVVFERDGGKVLVDTTSLEFLRGAILDYQESMMRSGYSIVENPISDMSCGCGVSFSPKV